MFSHQVLLFLSQIAQVYSRVSCEDLARRYNGVSRNNGTSRYDSEAFDGSATMHCSAHANKSKVLESASIKLYIRSNLNVLSNAN